MTEEVRNRKVLQLIEYYDDLAAYQNLSFEDYYSNRYSVERLIQLFVDTSVDLLAHTLKEKGKVGVKTYSQTFITAGNEGLIDNALAENLSRIAKIRNELVHLYGNVQPIDIHDKLNFIIDCFNRFIVEIKKYNKQ